MSGFSYPQPTFVSSIYNPSFYLTLDANGNLTYDYAKTIFLDRNDYRLAYLSGVSVGIGAPGTALVLNSSSSITGGLVDFTASGTLKGATINATTGFQLNGVALDFSNLSYLSGITAGTAANSKALILSSTGTISGIISLSAATINATTIQQTGTTYNLANMYSTGTASVTLSGTLSAGTISCTTLQQGGTSYTLSSMLTSSTTSISMTTITGTTVNASTTLQIGGTAITATAVKMNYCDITTLGTAQASKVITCNSLRDIININSLTASSLTGTIQTASQPNITSVGTLGSLTVSASVSCTKMNNTQSIITNGGANYLSGTSRVDPYNLVIVSPADTAGTASGIAFYNDGSGGVGFTASSFTPSCSIVAQRVAGSYAVSDLVFYTRSADADISALNERMRISQAGNISLGGIGGAQNVNLLTNDSCGFRIGAAESSKNCFTMQYTYAGAASSNNALSFDCYGTNNTLVIKSNGQVGINAAPGTISAELYVSGWITGTQMVYITANASSTASYVGNWSSSNYWGIGSDATVGSIRFGVCSITDSWSAYVPIRGGAYTNASDVRLKTDIVDCPYGLEAVMKMKPRRFKMIQEQTDHVGFIAQEMAEIVPEAVAGEECPNDTLNEQGFPVDPMGIDLGSLTSVLCKAIQEQQELLLSQQSRIEELEKTIASLI